MIFSIVLKKLSEDGKGKTFLDCIEVGVQYTFDTNIFEGSSYLSYFLSLDLL